MDEREFVSLDEAVSRLPPGSMVHTFRGSGGLMLGADHERSSLIALMAAAPEIEVSGPVAQRMSHGLAIRDDVGVLFIETLPAKAGTQ